MNGILENRKAAVAITVVIMILATLFGAHRSLTAKASVIEAYFVKGEGGYSIQRDLESREGLAKNLQVVANRYLYEGTDAMVELDNAINSMDRATTIQQKADANQALTAATERIYLELDGYPLTPADQKYRTQIRTDLASYNQMISHDKYNEMVVKYNQTVLGKFPANVLGKITGVSELPIF